MMQIDLGSFPQIETERLVLRKLETTDAEQIFLLRSDPELNKYIRRDPAKTIDDAYAFIDMIKGFEADNFSVLWAICLKNSSLLMGTVCLWNFDIKNFRAEIGYNLIQEFQGKGYIHEALGSVLDYGFNTLGLNSVSAEIDPDNQASLNVVKKYEFLQEAYFREHWHYNGEFFDATIHGLLKKEFNNKFSK